MAQMIPCDICEAEPAAMILTMVQTGDTQGVGFSCLEPWARGFADTIAAQHGNGQDMSGPSVPESNLAAVGVVASGPADDDTPPVDLDAPAPQRAKAVKRRAVSTDGTTAA